ncbi:hypothetical protein Tco_0277033 [Tanacetum coccineum]
MELKVNSIVMDDKCYGKENRNASLIVTKSSGTESEKHDTSSRSRNDTYAENADIIPVNDKEPMVEVQLTAKNNVLANGQQHAEQSCGN